MRKQSPHWLPLFGVRGMRKLEFLRPSVTREDGPHLLDWPSWPQSLLFTRVRLPQIARHHTHDIEEAGIGQAGVPALTVLNRNNPAVERARHAVEGESAE